MGRRQNEVQEKGYLSKSGKTSQRKWSLNWVQIQFWISGTHQAEEVRVDNPTMLPFCRSNRKDIIFTKKRNKQIPRVLCLCVAICIMKNVFSTYKWQHSGTACVLYTENILKLQTHSFRALARSHWKVTWPPVFWSFPPHSLSKHKQVHQSGSLSAFVMISRAAERSPQTPENSMKPAFTGFVTNGP